MPAPSQLAIQASALNRLVKEEASYYTELKEQEARIAKLEQGDGDENAEYTLRQERKAAEETKAMFPQLKAKIQDAIAKLDSTLAQADANADDAEKAKEALATARTALQETNGTVDI